MVVAFRRNCHGPRKPVGRFRRFEGSKVVFTQIKRRTIKQGCIKPEARFRLPVWRAAPPREAERSAHDSARACESRAPYYGRRFLPRIPAVRLICAGGAARRTIARGEPSGCTHDDADRCAQGRLPRAWISIRRLGKQPVATTRCSLLVLLHHRLILHLRRQNFRRHRLLRCPSS